MSQETTMDRQLETLRAVTGRLQRMKADAAALARLEAEGAFHVFEELGAPEHVRGLGDLLEQVARVEHQVQLLLETRFPGAVPAAPQQPETPLQAGHRLAGTRATRE